MQATIALVVSLIFVVGGVGSGRASWSPRTAPPQSQAIAGAETVTLLLVDDLTRPGFVAQVRRTGSGAKRTVITLKRSALSARLVAATFVAAEGARRRHGPDARVSVYISEQMALRPVAPGHRARIEDIVRQLRSAAPIDVPGVGRGPAITVSAQYGS
jgi:hypothetical protein